ncbi:hypothetical protein G6F22_021150 [Rhizopus arrhizus]|nr:hypothetical protein G6F22_021150 [Rhizopus arrhizus]
MVRLAVTACAWPVAPTTAAYMPLVRVPGRQHGTRRAAADTQDVDPQQQRKGMLVGQQDVEVGQADQRGVAIGGQDGCGHRCSRARQ